MKITLWLQQLSDVQLLFLCLLGALTFASSIAWVLKIKSKDSNQPVINNLIDRINAWWWMIGLIAVAFAFGKMGVVVLFFLVSFLALREFITLTVTRGSDYWSLVVSFYLILPIQYYLVWIQWYGLFTIMIPVYAFLTIPILSAMAEDTQNFLERTAKIQWGLMISVYCISHIPALLSLTPLQGKHHPILMVAFLILIVQLSDVLQYIWGKLFGKHKIAPVLSPSKTVEGLVGGILSSSLIGMLIAPIMTPFTHWEGFGMSLLLCLMGFLGGLVMSAIKRDRGIKDWGYLISGHGGILDRMDSLCFSAPVFFHITRYFWN